MWKPLRLGLGLKTQFHTFPRSRQPAWCPPVSTEDCDWLFSSRSW
jgi:hypothetical protein